MREIRFESQDANDDEVAAALAAVQVVLDEESRRATASEEVTAKPTWRAARLLEGVNVGRRFDAPMDKELRANPWVARMRVYTMAVLGALLFVSAPANAQGSTNSPAYSNMQGNMNARGNMNAQAPCPGSLANDNMEVPAYSPGDSPADSSSSEASADASSRMQQLQRSNTINGAAPPAVVTDNRRNPIRVGLAVGVSSTNISLPDGARIVELSTGEGMAEAPRQSQWTIATNGAGSLGNRLTFAGRFNNARQTQVLVARRQQEFQPVAYTPQLTATPAALRFGDFKRRPELVREETPRFSMPLVPFQKKPDLSASGASFGASGYLIMPQGDDGLVGVNGKLYRGCIVISANAKAPDTFNVINVVDVEDYLLSVVPSEMPSAWPLEALKAQAIAARSYAISNVGKNGCQGFDVRPTIDDQVYAGVQSEQESTNRAVAETNGLVLTHCDKVISAFFHSTSGGCTETAENVWTRPLPYLKSVPDYDDASPHFAWNRTVSVAQMESILAKSKRDIGGLLSMFPVSRGNSPRVKLLLVTGTRDTVFLTGEQVRGLLKLPSSSFNIGYANEAYVFAGRGFGHGLGLSQYGAKGLAEQGYNAPNILAHYFKDVSLRTCESGTN